MGYYIRKSVRVGPLTFNLSKTGVGVSAGITGLRVGFGPRGNYVHSSAAGFQYRTTLTPKATKKSLNNVTPSQRNGVGSDGMKEIDSDMTMLFQDSSEDALVQELTEKSRRMYFWKWAACLFIAAGFYFGNELFIAGTIITPLIFLWDETRKSVVIFYDFDGDTNQKYEETVNQFSSSVMKAHRVWHMEASAEVKDWKHNAGASRQFRRKSTNVSLKPPRFLKANIPIPTIKVGKQIICFLPDKLLIVGTSSAATIRYTDLSIDIVLSRFIETESVPSDAEVIDHTWQYVNKKGGPDKRFKNNRELPVCGYDAIRFTTTSGLQELIQVSKRGQFDRFRDLVSDLDRKAA